MEYELHVVEKPGRRVWYLRRVPAGKRQLLPLPSFTCERCSVQLVTPRPPIRHEAVHELGEPLAVATLQVMRHLVDDDVLRAVRVLLGEFDVEPDVAGFPVTRAPLRLHPADAPAWDRHVENGLPG